MRRTICDEKQTKLQEQWCISCSALSYEIIISMQIYIVINSYIYVYICTYIYIYIYNPHAYPNIHFETLQHTRYNTIGSS